MSFRAAPSHGARRSLVWAILATLACAHFALTYATKHLHFLNMDHYVHGQERTPFQFRTLMAWLMRPLGDSPEFIRFAAYFPEPLDDPYTLAQAGFAFLSLLGAVLVTRQSLVRLAGSRTFAMWASLLVVYMAHFQYTLGYGPRFMLPYDLPSLFFFSLAFWGIISQRLVLYYVAFAIGTLNRETMILMVVPFVVWNLFDASGRRIEEGRPKLLAHGALQIALWIGLKVSISSLYVNRAPLPEDTGLFEMHVGHNLLSILKPYQWPLFVSFFGFTLPFLFAFRDRIADARLRNVLLVLLPLWTVAMIVVGVIVEIRIFGEMIAPVTLGVAMAAWGLLQPFVKPEPTAS